MPAHPLQLPVSIIHRPCHPVRPLHVLSRLCEIAPQHGQVGVSHRFLRREYVHPVAEALKCEEASDVVKNWWFDPNILLVCSP